MKSFELVEPDTLAEAIGLLDPADGSIRAIAGGTALMLMMKARLFQPTRLVSLHRLNGELRGVRSTNDGSLSIGAMTSLRELGRSHLVGPSAAVITRPSESFANFGIGILARIVGQCRPADR